MAEAVPAGTRPGLVGFRISPIATQGIDWPRLDATWALAGQLDVFSAGWLSDHLADISRDRGGVAFESLTTAAALAHRVPGKWIGIAVLANTFRHPALVAKAATALDNATGGRFMLGLGAGWHEGEHAAFGIPLPPMRERFARYESAVATLAALFSEAARSLPGVSRDDPYYPLSGATLEPAPLRPEGPSLWLGGQGPRGLALAARFAEGWPLPGGESGNIPYFVAKREELLRAMEAAGRDPTGFTFAAQVGVENERESLRRGRETALEFRRVGADHIIIGVPAREGPDGIETMAREVAEPLRDIAG
ncbi:MAG TPA: LLM class flavin-dependent oxidoreductase [Candidatus Eisenbacteria bacterium]|nr:LLM class flavin-dependent oxidoreductase [Candidatus Eisenbacteria bacterium]